MPQTNEMHEMREITPQITRSLYRKTLRALKRKQSGFCDAANAAIDSEIATQGHTGNTKRERCQVLYSVGALIMGRHPRLIV